ncbi:hypothetical protein LAZ67_X004657 [Cordylochernes scorpioides]|uniref:Fibrinogen C-terminal domain-containing protein n=1 Tax=Cordylochernes scorpioides TaxID=51811 RepID=A0ABY6LXE0_9ARAC|nr:hypothetical protein LAZ67_X004657 [Cordylochernes scorpioides]
MILEHGMNTSGVYEIKVQGSRFKVYCDMETDGGGWLVFQRRGQFGNPPNYFFRKWLDYKRGFGNLNKEFWLALQKFDQDPEQQLYTPKIKDIATFDNFCFSLENECRYHVITLETDQNLVGNTPKVQENSREVGSDFSPCMETTRLARLSSAMTGWMLRVDLRASDGSAAYATYEDFWVEDESEDYMLHFGIEQRSSTYNGTAGDSLDAHNGVKFSTKDKPDLKDCAIKHKGAWWFKDCAVSHLNGFNYNGPHQNSDDGIVWYHFKGYLNSLSFSEMKIRPMY